MLQPVVERKGCQKVLGDMRDCLVETHCWGKCDEEVQRFQECINTKYFEEIVVEPEVEEIVAEHEVKSGEDGLESEVVDTIDEEVKSGVVSTSDESGNELNDDVKTTEEEPLVNEEVEAIEEESVVNEEVKTNEEQPVVNEEVKSSEEEPVVNEEVKTSEEESLVTEENTEDDSLDSNVDVNSLQDEKQEQPVITDNAELVDDNVVEVPNDSDIIKADETDTVDKDAFRIKIVSSSEKKLEEDENLLFRVTIKPNV